MIKVILSGGLGNQMFQYAAGRALSLKKKSTLRVDLQIINKKTRATKRSFELAIFNLTPIIKTSFYDKLKIRSFNLLRKQNNPNTRIFDIFCDEKAQFFDNRFTSLSEKSTLYGYFQNENYFKDISHQLRLDFAFKKALEGKNAEIQNTIDSHNSISLHIRRGDYLNSNSNLKVLDISYYQKAIQFISNKIENPCFFIFSDDINWVKENLDLKFNHIFVDWNTNQDSYIDMQLMSLCKHNIIANSSFSWWGAWLNNNPNKFVIAPSTWYKNDKSNNYPDGFIPKGWIVL